MDEKLRQLQLCELELLNVFVRICEEHGLRYYLVGGTLLGAVRHHGFVPWDDDVDVAMPRPDYNRFAELCREGLDKKYFYQSPDTDPGYFLTYAKLRRNGTFLYEERFRNATFHKGVFIDIIPLDRCPAPGLVSHFLFNIMAVMNYCGQVDSGEPYVPYREISGKLGYWLLQQFSARQRIRLRRFLVLLSERLGRGDYLASYSGAYGYAKEVFPAEWFGAGSRVDFEGGSYTAPAQPELQLAQIYGTDYMSLPPADQRKQHCDLARVKLKL